MAANTKLLHLALDFKQRLDSLGCPYTEDVLESWILEPLFQPGEPRIRLLQWLFIKFDGRLKDFIDPIYKQSDSHKDSRIQRLLYVASGLGMCRGNDVDLIKGGTSISKQVAFMTRLIDFASIVDTAASDQSTLFSPRLGLSASSESLPVADQFSNACLFADLMSNQTHMHTLFKPLIQLLPPDLQKLVEASWHEQGFTKDKPPVPEIPMLVETADRLSKDLHRQKDILIGIQKTYKGQSDEEYRRLDSSWRTLALKLTELSQQMEMFRGYFQDDLQHLCNREPLALSAQHIAFKHVHPLQHEFISLLENLQLIRDSHSKLNEDLLTTVNRQLFTIEDEIKIASEVLGKPAIGQESNRLALSTTLKL